MQMSNKQAPKANRASGFRSTAVEDAVANGARAVEVATAGELIIV